MEIEILTSSQRQERHRQERKDDAQRQVRNLPRRRGGGVLQRHRRRRRRRRWVREGMGRGRRVQAAPLHQGVDREREREAEGVEGGEADYPYLSRSQPLSTLRSPTSLQKAHQMYALYNYTCMLVQSICVLD